MTAAATYSKLRACNYSFFYLTLAVLIAFSAIAYANGYLSGDVAWYLIAGERLLDGQSNSESFFDTNPPMSFIIYLPAVLIHHTFNISIVASHLIYFFSIILINTLFVFQILKKSLKDEYLAQMISIFYLYTTTLAYFYIGHKDHMTGMALFPFICVQSSIHHSKKLGCIEKFVLAINAPFLLVKPHYLIIPAFFILRRLFTEKSIKAMFRADFFIMLAAGLLYTLVVFIFFQDFLTTILPIVSKIYAFNTAGFFRCINASIYFLLLASCLYFIFSKSMKNHACTQFIKGLVITIVFCIIAFILQGKGFLAHLFPAYIIITILFLTILSLSIQKFIDFKYIMLPFFVVLTIAGAQQSILKLNNNSTPFLDSVTDFIILIANAPINSFYIEGQTTDLSYKTALYTNKEHASRFPSRWLLDFSETRKDENGNYYDKPKDSYLFGNKYAEDFKRYKPDILFLYKDLKNSKNALYPNAPHKSILYYFNDHDAFQQELSHYEKTDDEFVFSYALYPEDKEKHSITYAIYKRKKDNDDE